MRCVVLTLNFWLKSPSSVAGGFLGIRNSTCTATRHTLSGRQHHITRRTIPLLWCVVCCLIWCMVMLVVAGRYAREASPRSTTYLHGVGEYHHGQLRQPSLIPCDYRLTHSLGPHHKPAGLPVPPTFMGWILPYGGSPLASSMAVMPTLHTSALKS